MLNMNIMGRKRIELNQDFGSPEKLLALSKETKDPLFTQRCVALRMLMLGESREHVMKIFDLKWTTLQKWVRLWNEGGLESISVGKPTGRPPKMTEEAKNFVVKIVEFTHPKTGEKVTGRFISGQLKKSVRDNLERECDLLSPSKDGIQPYSPPDASAKA